MWKHKNFINLQLCAGETWVLNRIVALPSGNMSVEFKSNNQYFATIGTGIMYSKNYLSYIDDYNDDTFVYREDTNTWVNQGGTDTTAYRTIVFDEPVTDTTLLTWLQANGTKQSTPQPTLTFKHFYDAGTIGTGTYKFRHYSQQEPSSGATLIDFTINGTAYQAEQGMTWEQWCNSSYNTSNGRYFISDGHLKYTSGYISGPSSTSTSTNPYGTDYPQANGVYTEVSGSGGSIE